MTSRRQKKLVEVVLTGCSDVEEAALWFSVRCDPAKTKRLRAWWFTVRWDLVKMDGLSGGCVDDVVFPRVFGCWA